MTRNIGSGYVVSMMVVAAVTVAAAKPGPLSSPTSVTSTVFDTDAFGNAVHVEGDDFPAEDSGVYINGQSGVISELVSLGGIDWNLDLRNSARGFWLTVVPTTGTVPAQLTTRTFYAGRIVSRCFDPSGGTATVLWADNTGDDGNCAMRVNFASGGTKYTLVMSPLYPGTGRALVHCNALGNSGSTCVDWTVTTNANVANAGVANLYSITRNGNEQFVAACALTFRMHVTNP